MQRARHGAASEGDEERRQAMSAAKTKTPRTLDDPRVRRVIRAIDHVIASPHVDELLFGVVEGLLSFGQSCHRFGADDGWTPANARATVIAFALNVPEPMLEVLAKVGDREVAWVTRWDRRGWLEAQVVDGTNLTLAQLKRAYAERVS